jgi:hypothetical protein
MTRSPVLPCAVLLALTLTTAPRVTVARSDGADRGSAGDDPAADVAVVDAAELDALLAELEAEGGILTAEERAALARGLRADVAEDDETGGGRAGGEAARGFAVLAMTAGPARAPRALTGLEVHGAAWRVRLRASRRADEQRLALWIRATHPRWRFSVGDGVLACGGGLVAAGYGRSRLAADDGLTTAAAGWRTSAALIRDRPRPAATLALQARGWQLDVGLAPGDSGRTDGHVQAGWGTRGARAVLTTLRRADGQAGAADLALVRAGWSLGAAGGVWRRGDGQAGIGWVVAAGHDAGTWLAELQLAAAGGAQPLDGARRPACLSGWRGSGWALRAQARAPARIRAAMVVGASRDRDPDEARGRRRERRTLEVVLGRRVRGAISAELRLRRVTDTTHAWDPLQPWLPATPDGSRDRIWIVASLAGPVQGGEGRVAWRRLEEAGEARNLLAVRWRRASGAVIVHAAATSAWGAPVDLVAVSAPVPGLVRLRHWGGWSQGLQLGLRSAGGAGWQLGGEWRRRAPASTATGPSYEVHAGWRQRF